jgi:FkbM family methyltransferase
MQDYRHNKIKTAFDIARRIENWPTAYEMRLWRKKKGLRLLRFRDSINIVCRSGSRDWDVIHELFFANSYGRAMRWLETQRNEVTVLDLGGNIGCFSILAVRHSPQAHVIAFEPGPTNIRIFKMNCLANPDLAGRIELREEAVGGVSGKASWFFDEANPGGSSLYSQTGVAVDVKMVAFAKVVEEVQRPISLAKIDIEGAEYDLLRSTSAAIWGHVEAISLELHDDPAGHMSRLDVLDYFRDLGYAVEEEQVCCFFLSRKGSEGYI